MRCEYAKPPCDPDDLFPERKGYILVESEGTVVYTLPPVEEQPKEDMAPVADDPVTVSYEGRELARTVGPVALTSGGVAGAAVIAAGGPTLLAVLTGVVVFGLVVAVIESSLRRITNDGAVTIHDGRMQEDD